MQESIGELAKMQQVRQGTDEMRNLRYAGGILKISPVGGNQRLTTIRQKEHELQTGWHLHLSKDFQNLSFERVM